MASNSRAPEFGQADLSNCELEKINLPSSIQPHGAMLVLREQDMVVVQASEGAAAFLELDGPVLGVELAQISSVLASRIRPHLSQPLNEIPIAIRCRLGCRNHAFDGLIHRPPSGGLIVEMERAGPRIDPMRDLETSLTAIVTSTTLPALCDESTRIFKQLTGYDRVMVYRFDEAGHGEVFAEYREPRLEPYLGNRYPASDIPQIARRLYERVRVRVLSDVDYTAVPLTPSFSPITGEPLDMSLCCLRSMSPIHIQYLKNMGVAATLVVSILVGGKLWGLIACHHYAPRSVQFETRAICEMLAETIATRIAALESFDTGQAQLLVRRLEQRMIDATSKQGDWRLGLFDGSDAVLQPVHATGAALLFDGQILTAGDVPATADVREIAAWLDGRPRTPLTCSSSFGWENPEFASLTPVASGLLATPVSTVPGEYLIWFRPEQIRTVTWGGNPFKPVSIGDNPSDLSPRRSFSQWRQVVEGTSEHWSSADRAAAGLIGDSVTDVVLQFRSLRMLIAQDQLAKVVGQVGGSDQPVVIADQTGKVLLCNDALLRLLPGGRRKLDHIDDLAVLSEDGNIRRRLNDLVAARRAWRGEVMIKASGADPATLLVRADPVFSAPNRVLGFVLLFEDISERKAAERARRRFQEGIVSRRRILPDDLGPEANVKLQALLTTVFENAQLAALEITDGTHPAGMPAMLTSVELSVGRAAALLALLLWHDAAAGDG